MTAKGTRNGQHELGSDNQCGSLIKRSYLPSGYRHSTDRSGARLRDGIRIPPFAELQMPYQFLVVAPVWPDLLVPAPANGRAWDLTIELPDGMWPFTFSFVRLIGLFTSPK